MGTEHPDYLKRFSEVTARKNRKLEATSSPSPA
jgi:hypothetical protein